MGTKEDLLREERDAAWVGDAVLSLFARRWILAHQHEFPGHGKQDLLRWMTSNQFLSAIGSPTTIESHIGKLYEEEGYTATALWIETQLLPLFLKQMHNRRAHRA
ncbi:MAG: hypothetical protein ACFCUX_02725 [Candidatus Methylacidiphilales bacterium]